MSHNVTNGFLFLQTEICLWQILINYKFLAGNRNNILTVSAVGFVCSLQVSRGESEKLNLAPVSATCSAWSHLSSAARHHCARLQMKTRRDRLPVISALAWCALINYTLQREVREKNPEKETFCWPLVGSRHCVSPLKWQLIWKQMTPGFPPTLYFFPSPPSDCWLTHQGNQISTLLVNHMWIFRLLSFSHSSPSANSLHRSHCALLLFHTVSKWALSAS